MTEIRTYNRAFVMTKYLPSIAIVVCFVLINSTQGNDVQLDFMLGELEPWGAVTLNDGKTKSPRAHYVLLFNIRKMVQIEWVSQI